MTPLHIELLLHAYSSGERHARHENATVAEYHGQLVGMGLIKENEHCPGSFYATARGAAHIKQICALALPVHQWLGADGKPIYEAP